MSVPRYGERTQTGYRARKRPQVFGPYLDTIQFSIALLVSWLKWIWCFLVKRTIILTGGMLGGVSKTVGGTCFLRDPALS